jgi:polyisoprenoid-binding protein YceI
LLAAILALPAAAQDVKMDLVAPAQVPAGQYKLDKNHASVTFKIRHMGMSNYTARFATLDATLDYDPKDVTKSRVEATIDSNSIRTDYPDVAKVDFDRELAGEMFLDAGKYPQMRKAGDRTGIMTGDLTLHGVTKPVTLNVTFNGGYVSAPMMKIPAMGFSATGTIKRSDFGITKGIPMVGDEVQILIEAEFHKAG